MHPTKIDLAQELREKIIELCNGRLADGLDLMIQAKQAHWNVKGPSFIALHELFDKVEGEVEEYVDLIAERVAQLGGVVMGTVRVAAQRSNLPEYPHQISDGRDHVEALSSALARFGKLARAAIDQSDKLADKGTADIFTEVSRGIDKLLWMVEAHQQAKT
jgi:starvation-inducible DNA-binding protein